MENNKQQTAVTETENNKPKTAVEVLMIKLYKKGYIKEIEGNEPINLMNQAKELEKRQIIDAWVDGDARICQTKSIHHAEQYYKETFE